MVRTLYWIFHVENNIVKKVLLLLLFPCRSSDLPLAVNSARPKRPTLQTVKFTVIHRARLQNAHFFWWDCEQFSQPKGQDLQQTWSPAEYYSSPHVISSTSLRFFFFLAFQRYAKRCELHATVRRCALCLLSGAAFAGRLDCQFSVTHPGFGPAPQASTFVRSFVHCRRDARSFFLWPYVLTANI